MMPETVSCAAQPVLREGHAMIIDCHGHYTTAPQELTDFRDAQEAALKDPAQTPSRASLKISDDQIRDSLEKAQLKLQRERGSDLTVFSPRASTMAHHIGNEATSLEWSQISNDLIERVVGLYPKNFVGVCMLPQSPGADAGRQREGAGALRQHGIHRRQPESGSLGRQLEGPAADGQSTGTRSTRSWCELDMPAMVHVSSSCNAGTSMPLARTTSMPTPPRSCS